VFLCTWHVFGILGPCYQEKNEGPSIKVGACDLTQRPERRHYKKSAGLAVTRKAPRFTAQELRGRKKRQICTKFTNQVLPSGKYSMMKQLGKNV
jgi:hypothetical protein